MAQTITNNKNHKALGVCNRESVGLLTTLGLDPGPDLRGPRKDLRGPRRDLPDLLDHRRDHRDRPDRRDLPDRPDQGLPGHRSHSRRSCWG